MASAMLCITADRDWVRLAAYRYALQLIAAQGAVPAWERDDEEPDAHELAEAVLRAFGDMEPER